MANEIKLTISVDDKGSLKIVAKDAEKAAKSIDKKTAAVKRASKAQEGLNVRHNQHNKLEKGTAGLGANSTKNFAKQAQTLGGTLVPAYATLAANIFALTAAFGALQRAAAFEQLRAGLVSVGSAAGQNLPFVAQQLKEITGAAVSTQEAMSAVALGTASGFSTKQLEDLTKVAKGASLALGRNMEDALSRLVRGTAKVEPEILDELGIMVRLDAAVQKYATTLGKSATQLTQFERSQAFLNATIEEGLEKFSFVADSVDSNPYDQLASTFNDLQKAGFKLINTVLTPLVSMLSSSPAALTGVLTIFGSTIISKIVPGINALATQQREVAAIAAQAAKSAAKEQSDAYTKSIAKVNASFKTVPPTVKKLEQQIRANTLTTKQYEQVIRSLSQSEQLRQGYLDSAHPKDVAARTQQLMEVKNLHAAIVAMHEAEKRGLTTSIAGRKAHARSLMATTQATALEKIGSLGAMAGFKEAIKGTSRQLLILRKTGVSAFQGIGIAAKAAGNSVKLFGRAFLNAIPIIGQAVFVGSLLWAGFKKLTEQSKVEKTVDELVDSFSSYNDIAKQLAVTLANPFNSATEDAIALMKAEVGMLGQVKNAIEKVQEARRKEVYDKRIQNAEKLWELTTRLAEKEAELASAKALRGAGRQSFDEGMATDALKGEINRLKKAIQEAQASVSTDINNLKFVDEEQIRKIVSGAVASIEAAGFGGEISSVFKRMRDEVDTALKEAGGQLEATQLKKILDKVLKDAGESALASLVNVKSAIQGLDRELNKLANKNTTVFDPIVNQLQSVTNEFNVLATNDTTLAEFFNKNKSFVAKVKKLWDKQGKVWAAPTITPMLDVEGLDSGLGLPAIDLTAEFRAQLENYNKFWKDNQAIMLRTKGTLADVKFQQQEINGITSLNPPLLMHSLDLEEKALTAKRDQLQAIDKAQDTLEAQLKHTREIEALEGKIARLQDIRDAKKSQAQAKLFLALFKMQKTLIDNTYKEIKANKQIVALRNEAAAARTGTDVSETIKLQEFLMFQEEAAREVQDNYASAVLMAQLTAEAETARLNIEKETINASTLGIEQKEQALLSVNAQLQLQEMLRDSTIRTADAARREGEARQQTTEEVLRQASAMEQLTMAQEALNLQAERFNLGDATVLANQAALASISLGVKNAENQWEVAKAGLVEANRIAAANPTADKIREAQIALNAFNQAGLELDRERTEELRKQLELLRAQAERGTRLGGEVFGQGLDVGVNIKSNEDVFKEGAASDKIEAMGRSFTPMMEQLRELGPEGELYATIAQGATFAAEAWTRAFEEIGSSASKMDQVGAAMTAVAASVNALSQIQQAQSRAAEAGIDREIAAEKRRDGKSKQSLAKIASLEKKKDAIKRKAFEQDKKMKMAQVVMATSMAIMQAAAGPPGLPWSIPIIAMAAALGAAQLAAISGTSYEGGAASAGAGAAVSKVSMGERQNRVDLAQSRSASGELSYFRGELGTGSGASNYVPRAFTGRATGGSTAFVVGEQGP
jgi:hypothetical protein